MKRERERDSQKESDRHACRWIVIYESAKKRKRKTEKGRIETKRQRAAERR